MDLISILIASHLLVSLIIAQTYGAVNEVLYLRPNLQNVLLAILISFTPIVNVLWIFVFLFQTLKREDV